MRHILKGSDSGYEAHGWAKGEGDNLVFLVHFDVALTAEEGTKTKGGIGVVAGVFALGTQGAFNESSSAISRIQFKVPLLLPMHKKRMMKPNNYNTSCCQENRRKEKNKEFIS